VSCLADLASAGKGSQPLRFIWRSTERIETIQRSVFKIERVQPDCSKPVAGCIDDHNRRGIPVVIKAAPEVNTALRHEDIEVIRIDRTEAELLGARRLLIRGNKHQNVVLAVRNHGHAVVTETGPAPNERAGDAHRPACLFSRVSAYLIVKRITWL